MPEGKNALPPLPRLVLDTNILLSGMANRSSASGQVLAHCESRRALLLMSRPIQAEYRRVLGSAEMLRRNAEISHQAVELIPVPPGVLARAEKRDRFVSEAAQHLREPVRRRRHLGDQDRPHPRS